MHQSIVSKNSDGRTINRRTLLHLTGGGVGLAVVGPRLGPIGASAQDPAPLLVGSNFSLQSLDPGRGIETTTNMVNHSTYDSLVTFEGEDLTTPVPSLATEWMASDDGTRYTFTLRPDVTFVSGNPLTSSDVKWSLDRVKNLQSNAAFLIERVTEVQAPDPMTVVLILDSPYPAILPILSSSSLGIIDSQLVSENGGVSGPDAAETDTAETFLQTQSAGTGAYSLSSYLPDQEVVLVANPNHWRGAPSFERIVIRNITEPATQQLQLESGDLDIATGLSQDQIVALDANDTVAVQTSPAATTFYVLMNNNEQVGGPFSNPLVQEAVRYALDYEGILALVGPGTSRLAGIIPTVFAGARDPELAVMTDREQAMSLLAEADLGEITGELSYASDSTIWGVDVSIMVQKIQADLAEVGMTIELDGLPRTTALQKYRDGENQIGLWSWAADYPDTSNFLVYLPGRTVGLRAGWLEDASPEAQEAVELGEQAETATNDAERLELYQQLEEHLAEVGPYAPLFQPAVPYAFAADLDGVTFHSVWGVDFYTVQRSEQ